jgi:hypothetical protein
MPFTFSFAEDTGGVCVYSFCGGDGIRASAEYQLRYLDLRMPKLRVFT